MRPILSRVTSLHKFTILLKMNQSTQTFHKWTPPTQAIQLMQLSHMILIQTIKTATHIASINSFRHTVTHTIMNNCIITRIHTSTHNCIAT